MRKIALILVVLTASCARARAADRPLPQVPGQFQIQLAASEPRIRFPMFACFDDKGRLFVAESSGLDLYAELQKLTRRCRISVLEDKNDDGVFETAGVFADKLVFPMGLAWRDGKLYVADPPELVTLQDIDGDGKADKRTKILENFGHQDNGSLHGLIFGPDDLLYMTMGQPDGYKITKADGTVVHGTTGAVLRCRPDGSHAEVVARGFENAVEICFLPAGQIIATDNWFQLPAGGVRDALVHVVEGGLYPHCADRGSWQIITGDTPMPAVSLFPAVALSGICRYEGASFPQQFRGNLYTAQHNTRKVQRHVLEPAGHTFKSQNLDFVTSDDPDFHPSDVLEAPDGSLLVVDTGGWYVQHCPTGKIRNSQAPGGIYRVRAKEAKRVADPLALKIDFAKAKAAALVELLSDARPTVREKARRAIGPTREAAASLLKVIEDRAKPLHARTAAVRGLSAMQTEVARVSLRDLLTRVRDREMLALLARTLSVRSDPAAAGALHSLLASEHADVRLAAAEALAHCGNRNSIEPLVKALAAKDVDRFLEHALVHAIHRHATLDHLRATLNHAHPKVQAAALMLLDQPPHQTLDADAVFSRVSSDDSQLAQTALGILQKHGDWAARAAQFFTARLQQADLDEDQLARLSEAIVALGTRSEIISWLGASLTKQSAPDRRPFLLQAMARIGRPKEAQAARAWVEPLESSLGDPRTRSHAIATATALSLPALDEVLLGIAAAGEDQQVRLAARRAALARHPQLSPADFDLLLSQLSQGIPAATRLIAADIASRAELGDEQLRRLLQSIRDDPLVTPNAIFPLLSRSAKPASADLLFDYVARSINRGWTPSEQTLTDLFKPLASSHGPRIDQLLVTVRKRLADQQSSLEQLRPLLAGGDEIRGRALFFGAAACSTCHRAGNEGSAVGPDLTKVGAIRSGRDLLESIVYPSSTIAQGYDGYIVTLTDGDVLSGFVSEKTADAVVIKDATGAARRLAMTEVKDLRRSEFSMMPQGLEQAISREQLRDLLSYLQSLR